MSTFPHPQGLWLRIRGGRHPGPEDTVRRNFGDFGAFGNLSDDKQVRMTRKGLLSRSSRANFRNKVANFVREGRLFWLVISFGPKGSTGNRRTIRTIQPVFLALNSTRLPRSRRGGSAVVIVSISGPENPSDLVLPADKSQDPAASPTVSRIRHLPRVKPAEGGRSSRTSISSGQAPFLRGTLELVEPISLGNPLGGVYLGHVTNIFADKSFNLELKSIIKQLFDLPLPFFLLGEPRVLSDL